MRFLLILSLLLISCKEEIDKEGTLRVTGNHPFTQLVFTADGVDYRLPRDLQKEYMAHQNKRARVKGSIESHEMTTVDGSVKLEYFTIEPDSIIVLE